jgi:undecaprenyl-diphosphatase
MEVWLISGPLFKIVLIVVLAVLFGLVTLAVSHNRSLAGWDIPFGAWVISKNTRLGKRLFFAITELGSYKGVRLGIGLIGVGLVLWEDWRHLTMLVGLFALTMLVTHFLKPMLPRSRPQFPQDFLSEKGLSFPFSHTMLGTAFYLMAAYLGWTYLSSPMAKLFIQLAAGIVILLIGFNRIYLGVHFLTDVIGGWIAGSLMFLIVLLAGTFLLYTPGIRLSI